MMRKILSFGLWVVLISACSNTSKTSQPQILQDFIKNGSESILPDFSYAGYAYGEKPIDSERNKTFNVTDFGAIPDDGADDTRAIQAAVDAAGANPGGGIVSFPAGTFHVNLDTARLDIIRINQSNIIMRGAGSGKDGTIIHSGSQTTQSEENSPWLSPFVFHTGLNLFGTDRFYNAAKEEPLFARFTKDCKKGDNKLTLSTTKGLKPGDHLTILMRNTTDDGDLMKTFIGDLKYDPFQTSYINAGKNRDASFQWIAQVQKVLSDTEVKIAIPTHRDIRTKFDAFVVKTEMLSGIGIEGFRFECDYKGGYKHHLNREHDYGWGAICMHRVAHGWVRNVSMHNYVQNVHLINSKNISVFNVKMTGLDGHYGVKMYHSSDNLVYDIDVEAKYTHGPGLEGCSFGNVYRNINMVHASPIDLHGIADVGFCPPMYNLYENMKNLTAAAGGGAPANIPHAGEYNVFWNLEMAGIQHGDFEHELFHSWIWRDAKRFKNEVHEDCHKQYSRTIVVGAHHPEYSLTIAQSTADRSDEWIYVEGLNKNMNLPSLYEFQLKSRLSK